MINRLLQARIHMYKAHHTNFPAHCHILSCGLNALLALCWLSVSLQSAPSLALEAASLSLGSLQGKGWQLSGLEIQLDQLQSDSAAASLQITRLNIASFKRPLTDLRIRCAQFALTTTGIQCQQGRLDSRLPILTALTANLSYQFNGDFELRLSNSRLRLHVSAQQQHYQVTVQTDNLDLSELQTLTSYVGDWLNGWTVAGRGDIKLTWRSAQLPLIKAQLRDFSYANDTGSQAGEKLDLALHLTPTQGYRFALSLARGDVYIDPLFISHVGPSIDINGEINWQHGLHVSQLHYNHPGIGSLNADVHWLAGKLHSASLSSDDLNVRQLYQRYLRSYLNDQKWPELSLSGTARLHLEWGKALELRLKNISVASRQARGFIVNGINASVYWQNASQPPAETVISWLGARFPPAISIGPGSLQANLHNQHLRLSAPLTVPILDGALHVETLAINHAFSEQPEISFAGEVQPISMQAASTAFGWPELGGEISGKIPGIRYHDKRLQIDAALLLTVFGGSVIIHNLSLQNPLGEMPQLRGDVVLSELDLDLLTRFFSFGAITGHLSGQISKLHMINWEPMAFDAFFQSSDHETDARKISQKAINNLSSLGGAGVTQALSRSVLRMFEHFSYSQLGWGCHLQNGLCQMRGIEANAGGYYIVKGGHLPPRIDVRGYNQRVDWNDLLRRLKSITAMGAPTIE